MTEKTLHTNHLNTETPKISVIVPAYNVEEYLEKCLDSIFNQTFKDFEVIVVNDGSTDHTREICERYAAAHPKMAIINQKNGGLSCARNSGLNICNGTYIAFVDSDDYVEEDWLESFMVAFSKYSTCDMAIQGLIINYRDHENIVSLPEKYYEGEHIINAYYDLKKRSIDGFTHNKIYKRNIIVNNNIRFELKLKEDLLFNYKYLSSISALVIIPNCSYHYVQHDSGSLIHRRYSADFMRTLITTVRDAGLLLANKYQNGALKKFIINDYILAYSVLLFSMYQKVNGIDNKTERIKYIKEYQQTRKENKNLKIKTKSKAKLIFASLMMIPPKFADFIMSILNKIK